MNAAMLLMGMADRVVAERCALILAKFEGSVIRRDRISAMALLHLGLSALASYDFPRDAVHQVVDQIYDRMVAEVRQYREEKKR